MYIVFFILMIAALIVLIILNMNATKSAKSKLDVQPDVPKARETAEKYIPAEKQERIEPPHEKIPPAKPLAAPAGEHSDSDYRQALLKLSGHAPPDDTPGELADQAAAAESAAPNTDEAYREGLRSFSQRQEEKD